MNPLDDFKTLYATGVKRFDATGALRTVSAIQYVVKDGIIYDAGALRDRIKDIVRAAATD